MAKGNMTKKNNNEKISEERLKREVEKYMKLPYTIKLIPEEDGTYYVAVEELPGCASMGDTVNEALEMIKDAMEGWLESSIDRGLEIPLPEVMREYSGRFVVRVPVSLHKKLAEAARREGVSLNQYVVSLLSENYSVGSIETLLKDIGESVRNTENAVKSANKSVQSVQRKDLVSKGKIINAEWEERHGRNGQYLQRVS
jgi:predicted RNase H-like HicB family nuclease